MAHDQNKPTRLESGGLEGIQYERCQVRVVKGPDKGLKAELFGERIRIGRGEPNDLPLTDERASRLHAEIVPGPEGIRLVDLGSRNGTHLGDHRVIEAFLVAGAKIRIGGNTMVFETLDGTVSLPLSARHRLGNLIGTSKEMRRTIETLGRAAATDVTVLLRGETGTGKEEAARAIHQSSARSEGPFVVLDCGSIPGTLLASELFGHERGAFTGATEVRRGALERAHGGTLFLDELGELATELQPQLLRVLERREFQRLGGDHPAPVDVRIVAATNRDLRRDVNAGRFRADLYFRLAVVEVVLPPLRERPEDIPLLAQHLFDEICQRTGASAAPLSPVELEQLVAHYWPGNVRELRNAIDRRVLVGTELDLTEAVSPSGGASFEAALLPYREAKARVNDQFEVEYVRAILKRSEGNISKAAREANMDRSHLVALIKKHGLAHRES